MSARRLEQGGFVNRRRPVAFSWDGRAFEGVEGDTLASALMASGERVIGRGFKYHRPRGVTSAGVEEGGAIVSVGAGARRVANVRASTLELVPGVEAFGQNAWPSVRFDLGRINDRLGRFFGAGFYYKTFMGPGRGTAFWMAMEPIIRRAAGMGAAAREADPDHYEIVHDHCDLLIVGSGAAGLAAAEVAAEAGLDAIVADQDFQLGGDLMASRDLIGDRAARGWRADRFEGLDLSDVRFMPRATVFGLYDGCVAGVLERVTDMFGRAIPGAPRERVRIVRARRIVVASGALERPIAFGDNDLPGVMGAAAARTYAARYAVLPGERAAVATTNDSGYEAALTLAEAGAAVALVDARAEPPAPLVGAAEAAGVEVIRGHVPVKADGGRAGVEGLWIGRHLGGGRARPDRRLDVEIVAVSGGWSPAVHLLSQRKIRPVWDGKSACFVPGETGEPIHVCGAAAGVWTSEGCAGSGRAAGVEAARALGAWGGAIPNTVPRNGWDGPIEPVYEVRAEGWKLKSFVDPQHDVTADDVRLAAREGFQSVEHLKRYTTLGMATDQGKLGNVVGLAIMAEATGRTIAETGTTVFRPPYTPVSIGALAGAERGALWRPTRYTPMHERAAARGAVFTDAGAWKRAWYFPRAGEGLAEASRREAQTVRASVGMVDVSTLGKIAVQGPDAAEFLNRVYANGFAKLAVGRARYGLMLREDGIALDDGTTWRLSETEFFTTTTTAEAAEVMEHMERLLQTRWTDLRVHVASVSDGWAGVAVAGPKARDVLAPLVSDIDWSDEAFPFMGVREGTLTGGVPVRAARISFSGERAWELFAPADCGSALWDAVSASVEAAGGCPYGLEALDILRVEKGHVTAREIDGRATADDLGLGAMASKKKAYIGSALKERPGLADPQRPALVGLRPAVEGERFKAGAVLCEPGQVSGHGVGWVSSIADSPHCGWIGLGLAAGGLDRWRGARLIAADPVRGAETELEVVSPVFIDPEGERLRG